MAAVATLVDNFDDNSRNASLWEDPTSSLPAWVPAFSGLGGTAVETGGAVVLTAATSTGDTGIAYESVDVTYELTGSSAYLYLASVPTANGSQNTGFVFALAAGGAGSEKVNFRIDNNFGTVNIYAESNAFGDDGADQGGTWSDTYDNTNHRWLRIREASGTIYWETAPDSGGSPGTWTARRTLTSASSGYPTVTDMQVGFGIYTYSSTASPQAFTVDNFNTTSATGPARPVIFAGINQRLNN